MAKINGTSLLIYADGVLIAAQKSCTVSWEQDLPGATTKDSAGWEEHINGTRRATCDFDGLYSTTGLTADGLINYILSRSNIILLIDGGGFPIVGEATPKGVTIGAVKEEAATFSGSFKFNGPAWMLTGTFVSLITKPDQGYNDYDTMLAPGIDISSAINIVGGASVYSNVFAVTLNAEYKLVTFLSYNSGELPLVELIKAGPTIISETKSLVAGFNILSLTATETVNAYLRFKNTAAANWGTSNIYLFKI